MRKKGNWNQPKGGWSPFGASSPKAKAAATTSCRCYDAFDRVRGAWFTQKCAAHR